MDRDRATLSLGGQDYVVLPREEFDRLTILARAADLPPLPEADASGNLPASAYARASLARKVIRGRVESGLTQRALAKLAGISFEHLNRIEGGRHTPSIATMAKIERALARPSRRRKSTGRS